MSTANQHRPNDFTPVVGAMELAEYVFHITENPSKFPDFALREKTREDGSITQICIVRDDSLTNAVRAEAREIFHLTFSANEINLNRQPWRKEERLGKQKRAIELCGDMLADIQLCRKHFHLSTKRIRNWGSMVVTLRTAIEGWHEKDKYRYREL